MEQAISMQDIAQAAERIRPYIKKTPLMRAEKLEALFGGAEIWLKLENFQITGSFKLRGVANKVCTLTEEELKRGVPAASSGNPAQAVSYMAAHFLIKGSNSATCTLLRDFLFIILTALALYGACLGVLFMAREKFKK